MAQAQDNEQLIGQAIQPGAIASVDHANATCTVEMGDIVTGEIPWVAMRAGGTRYWSPPTIGEQCLVLAPEGDIENGLVVLGLYSDACPPPSNDPDVTHLEFPDGATLSYNHANHALAAILPAGGTVAIEADGGVSINGPLQVTGPITASEDVTAGGISLMNHKHGGVQAGGSQTGAPA